ELLMIVGVMMGVVGGLLLGRKYMMEYLKKKGAMNEEMLGMMMMEMGEKGCEKKMNEMMRMMKKKMDEKMKS
uniref:YneF family protein n=1 Tax=Staphylococcus hominis TaxID=1290 RepID=UPI0011A179DA